jgi:hypothetical protein
MMRPRVLISLAVTVLLSAAALHLASAGDKAAITVELKTFKFKVPAGVSADLFGLNEEDGKLFLYTNGAAEAAVKVPADGDYEIVVKASCDPAKDEFAKFKLSIDGKPVGKETALTAAEVKEYKVPATLKAGERKLSIAFTNDVYKENEYDRNFYVHGVTVKKVK